MQFYFSDRINRMDRISLSKAKIILYKVSALPLATGVTGSIENRLRPTESHAGIKIGHRILNTRLPCIECWISIVIAWESTA
jgi:hypothetical protein